MSVSLSSWWVHLFIKMCAYICMHHVPWNQAYVRWLELWCCNTKWSGTHWYLVLSFFPVTSWAILIFHYCSSITPVVYFICGVEPKIYVVCVWLSYLGIHGRFLLPLGDTGDGERKRGTAVSQLEGHPITSKTHQNHRMFRDPHIVCDM